MSYVSARIRRHRSSYGYAAPKTSGRTGPFEQLLDSETFRLFEKQAQHPGESCSEPISHGLLVAYVGTISSRPWG